jgi:EAL domain-containing protein (putative c-di-GMP-specific phosphodiesterase class I)
MAATGIATAAQRRWVEAAGCTFGVGSACNEATTEAA